MIVFDRGQETSQSQRGWMDSQNVFGQGIWSIGWGVQANQSNRLMGLTTCLWQAGSRVGLER